MKFVFAFLLAVGVVGAADAPPAVQPPLPQVRKERRDHRDPNGTIDAYTETVYRGTERILVQATYITPTRSGIKAWREVMVSGKTVVKEMDYGDKQPQVVWVYRDGAVFEGFHRHSDGSLEPISSEELAKTKQEAGEFMTGLERVLERVKERTDEKK